MPQVEPRKPKKKWRLPLIVAGCVVALALIGGGVWYMQWLSQAQNRFNTAISNANSQAQFLQYNDAIATYQDYLKTYPTKDRKYQIEVDIAQVYWQKEDYGNAITWYQKAEKDGTRLDLVIKPGIAEAAQMAGNKSLSIDYYKQSIALLKKQVMNPSNSQSLGEYEAGLTSQGGKE